ncbi:hypothetical protein OIU76_007898 [Salix suchowensis]|nr:hypothetical protein OIU76_007898 [Salix suchowensis]
MKRGEGKAVTALRTPAARNRGKAGLNQCQRKSTRSTSRRLLEVAVDVFWGNLKDSDHGGVSFFVGDADHGLVNGSDLECQSLVPTTSTLEKLYQEYLQVLNTNDHHDQVELNSFAESLLV